MQERLPLSFLMTRRSMILQRIIKNFSKTINWLFAQIISHILMTLNVFHVLKEHYFLWFKKVVEHVRLVLILIKIRIIVKRNLIIQIYKIQIGPVKKLILKYKKIFNYCQKIHFLKNALLRNLFQLANNVFNAVMMNILILIKRNAINVTMVKASIKISMSVHTLKPTSKQIQKKHQTWSLKADQRINGCTFTTKISKRMMEWLIVLHKNLISMD